jgi:hypothetical protein
MTIDSTVPCATALVGAYESDLEAQILGTNCMVQEADRHFWEDRVAGRQVARRVLQRFVQVAGVLEARGWSRERIKGGLQPSRQVFATSPFMQRCQEWPRATPAISKRSSTWWLALIAAYRRRLGGILRACCWNRRWYSSIAINYDASRRRSRPQ